MWVLKFERSAIDPGPGSNGVSAKGLLRLPRRIVQVQKRTVRESGLARNACGFYNFESQQGCFKKSSFNLFEHEGFVLSFYGT